MIYFVIIMVLFKQNINKSVINLCSIFCDKLFDKESEDSRLKVASDMIEKIYIYLGDQLGKTFVYDSWYAQGKSAKLYKKYMILFIYEFKLDTASYRILIQIPPRK